MEMEGKETNLNVMKTNSDKPRRTPNKFKQNYKRTILLCFFQKRGVLRGLKTNQIPMSAFFINFIQHFSYPKTKKKLLGKQLLFSLDAF